MNQKIKTIQQKCERTGVKLTDEQAGQFYQYYEMLVEKNKVMNLTAITEFEEVVQKHFVDSLSLVKTYDLSKACKVIDIGTGAGFPGIPLKIAFPQLQIVLLDSLNKRIQFLNEVIETLGLKEIEAIHGRAEDLARNKLYREQFDLCISRAVANLSSLSEYCLPFVKKGGVFISYKSSNVEEELEQARKAVFLLGGKIENKTEFLLPDSDITRCLIQVKKEKNTSSKYPRKAGLPSKEPLS
jgi:16S rRNA (guanine527-N7)-methyltransferase